MPKLRFGKVSSLGLALFVLCVAVYSQLRFDGVMSEHFDLQEPVHRFVAPAKVVRMFSFGFDNALADYYFVTSVQSYVKWDGKDDYYLEYFRIISTLDPLFEYPYIFAILTLPNKLNPETSLIWTKEIATIGGNALPDNWLIPFTAAMQFHVVGKLNTQAIYFLKIASEKPTATELVKRTYAIYLMKDATDYKRSRALFLAILETADNDETKRIISERLELLDVVEVLEGAIDKYKKDFGVYPTSVVELAHKIGVTSSDQLLKKYNPTIDQESGKLIFR